MKFQQPRRSVRAACDGQQRSTAFLGQSLLIPDFRHDAGFRRQGDDRFDKAFGVDVAGSSIDEVSAEIQRFAQSPSLFQPVAVLPQQRLEGMKAWLAAMDVLTMAADEGSRNAILTQISIPPRSPAIGDAVALMAGQSFGGSGCRTKSHTGISILERADPDDAGDAS